MKRRQIIVHFGILCLVLLIGTVSYVQACECSVSWCYKGGDNCGWEGCKKIVIMGDDFWEKVDQTYSYAYCIYKTGGSKLCGYTHESVTCAEYTTYTDPDCSEEAGFGWEFMPELAECSEACN